VASTAEMLAQLEAQRAHFASDEHLIERADVWRDATPEECLAATFALCEDADAILAMKSPEELERAQVREPLPPDLLAILAAIARPR
jgi:uncharacterized membrane protein